MNEIVELMEQLNYGTVGVIRALTLLKLYSYGIMGFLQL